MIDETLLRRAIALAAEARSAGDPPFGSLLAAPPGSILREERNTTLTERDITAHPELKLARWAAASLPAETAAATTMYTSCEPCTMCASAIARAGIGRVVYALSGEQLDALKPPTATRPGAVTFRSDGPCLASEATEVVRGYYG